MAKILVTGATGNTGSGLVLTLLNAGVDVRAFVRDEAKAQSLKDAGVEIVVGDLDNVDDIVPAVDGVDKVYLLTWNGPTQAQQVLNVLEAIKKAGVSPHIVRHSMWGSEKSRIVTQGNQAEKAIKASGLPWTFVSPTFFMQNLMMGIQTIQSDGNFYWDLADAKLAMIDIRDIVDSAAAVLAGSGHEGKEYILTGPEAISLHDVADAFSEAFNKDVTYIAVPSETSLDAMLNVGFPEWIARGYGELMEGFREGFADEATNNVETLTGHPARSIEDFARDFAGYFVGTH